MGRWDAGVGEHPLGAGLLLGMESAPISRASLGAAPPFPREQVLLLGGLIAHCAQSGLTAASSSPPQPSECRADCCWQGGSRGKLSGSQAQLQGSDAGAAGLSLDGAEDEPAPVSSLCQAPLK